MKLEDIRLLPREVPRDPVHESILMRLVNGEDSPEVFMQHFNIPGVGFHSSLYILTLHLAEYRMAGGHTFVIPEQMQSALVRTSLEGVEAKDLRFPFRSQYVSLPNFGAEIWGGERTGWHKVGGVMVRFVTGEKRVHATGKVEAPPENDPGVVYLYIWGMENEKSTNKGDDASLWLAIDLEEVRKSGKDLESYLWEMLEDPDRKETIHGVEEMAIANAMGFLTTMPDGEEGKKAKRGAIDTVRVVFNALLYMDSEGAEMEEDPSNILNAREISDLTSHVERVKNPNKKKARHLRRRLESIPKDVVTWVGRSNRTFPSEGDGKAESGPMRRHWVRGHWWPRRDTIQYRIKEAEASLERTRREYGEFQSRLGNVPDHGEALRLLGEMGRMKKRVEEAEVDLQNIRDSVGCRRRWVKPYQKGSVGEVPDNHIYKM